MGITKSSTIAGPSSRTLCAVEARVHRSGFSESCHRGIDSECSVRIIRVQPTADSLTVTDHLISLSWLLIRADPLRRRYPGAKDGSRRGPRAAADSLVES